MVLLATLPAAAQTDRDLVRSGNRLFRQKKYSAAEVDYRKAVSKNAENPQALYNLGCALMMQNKASDAVKFYQKAAAVETSKPRKAQIYHNIGVICQAGKMYGEAIKAYSEALRNNPSDNETRYNLALCKKLQKNDKNNDKNNKQKDNKDNKQQGKDKQQEQNDQKDKDKDKQNQNQKSQPQPQPQMSKDNAEQLLNAAMQQEQQTQERLNRSRQQQQSRHLDKNW